MNVCRCEPKGIDNGDGECVKCGKSLTALAILAPPPPTDGELRRRRKISEYNRGRRKARRGEAA